MKINVSFGRTFNIGNYESVRVDVSKERELSSDADFEATFYAILNDLKELVNEQESELKRTRGK